jgi:hypothetical protein
MISNHKTSSNNSRSQNLKLIPQPQFQTLIKLKRKVTQKRHNGNNHNHSSNNHNHSSNNRYLGKSVLVPNQGVENTS